MQNYAEQNRFQYFADILILIGLVLLCATVFSLLGAMLSGLLYNLDYKETINMLSDSSDSKQIGFLKFYNAVSTLGAWVVSGFLFSKIRSFNINLLWQFQIPRVRFIWFLLPILFISSVIISAYLLDINQRLPLPDALTQFFDSMDTAGMLDRMLHMETRSDLFINLIIIALLPALFEEIFFRGTLQPMLIGFFKNHHLGIWFCSFVFALIHLNIHQFIPMMFLALVLGYIFYYSQSIYPGMLIHFLNNALAVFAYYYKDKSTMANKIVEDNYAPDMWLFIVFSLVLVTIFYFIIEQHKFISKHE